MAKQVGIRGGKEAKDVIRVDFPASPGRAHKIPNKAPGTTNNVYVPHSRSLMQKALGHK